MDFPKCLPEVFPPLLMEEPRRNQLEWGAWSSMDRSGCHRWGCSINKYLNSYRIKLFQSASACAGNGQALPTVLHVHQTPFFHFYLYNLCLTSSLLLVWQWRTREQHPGNGIWGLGRSSGRGKAVVSIFPQSSVRWRTGADTAEGHRGAADHPDAVNKHSSYLLCSFYLL